MKTINNAPSKHLLCNFFTASLLVFVASCASKSPPSLSHAGKIMDGCTYGGVNYSDGAVVCQSGTEYVCSGGSWQSTGQRCDGKDGILISQQIALVSKDTVSMVVADKIVGNQAAREKKKGPTPKLECLSFFPNGVSSVGIRNNCKDCKFAVVNWTPRVGIKRYRVEGYNQITIKSEDQSGFLIGEDPCK